MKPVSLYFVIEKRDKGHVVPGRNVPYMSVLKGSYIVIFLGIT